LKCIYCKHEIYSSFIVYFHEKNVSLRGTLPAKENHIIGINRMLYNCFREVNKRAKDGQILYDIFIFVSVFFFCFLIFVFFFYLFSFLFPELRPGLKLHADLKLLLVRFYLAE